MIRVLDFLYFYRCVTSVNDVQPVHTAIFVLHGYFIILVFPKLTVSFFQAITRWRQIYLMQLAHMWNEWTVYTVYMKKKSKKKIQKSTNLTPPVSPQCKFPLCRWVRSSQGLRTSRKQELDRKLLRAAGRWVIRRLNESL